MEISKENASDVGFKGFWLKSEEAKPDVKIKNEENKNNNFEALNQSEHSKIGNKTTVHLDNQKLGNENIGNETRIPTNLIKYYGITCNTILGHSDLKVNKYIVLNILYFKIKESFFLFISFLFHSTNNKICLRFHFIIYI